MSLGELRLNLAGLVVDVAPGTTFGRMGDLVVDSHNPFMHRVCGRIDQVGDQWKLSNVGASTPLIVVDQGGQRVRVLPSGAALLNPPSGTISFVAGPTPYELSFSIEVDTGELLVGSFDSNGGQETVKFGAPLTARELCYLSSFARPRLTGAGPNLPTFLDVATEWGVSERTVENTIRRVRTKMRESGMRGVGTIEDLVEQLVSRGVVTQQDLVKAEQQHKETG